MAGMGRVFKPSPRHVNHWIQFRDHQRVMRNLPAFRDKRTSQTFLRNMERLSEMVAAGGDIPEDLVNWLSSKLDAKRREKLIKFGLIDQRMAMTSVPLFDEHTLDESYVRETGSIIPHIDMWRSWLINLGRTSKHINLSCKRAVELFDDCGFELYADINIEEVLDKVAQWGHRSKTTQNHYLRAAKMFCKWMKDRRRAVANRLDEMPITEPKEHEIKHDRQPLTVEQIHILLEALMKEDAKFHHFMPGSERALVYWLVIETGLRANELYSLTVESFELGDMPGVHVSSAYTKNGESARCPISRDLADALKRHFSDGMKMPDAKPFTLPSQCNVAEMLQHDLEAVGIAHHAGNKVIDFHALRTTFITNAVRSDIHFKKTQELARHKTMQTTMKHYAKVALSELAMAHEKLPSVTPSVAQSVARPRVETGQNGSKRAT